MLNYHASLQLFFNTFIYAIYLPILKEFFAAFACEYVQHTAEMRLIVDNEIICWNKNHFIMMGASFISLCLYYPLVLRALPLAQSMKEHYASYHNVCYLFIQCLHMSCFSFF